MSEQQLTVEIIVRSQAKVWEIAKTEWLLEEVYEADEPDTCLCGHFPIREICVLRNKINKNDATVGNCCVKKFIGLPSDKIFQAVKRVRKEIEKSLNAEALQYALQRHWISEWEKDFYFDIMKKRNLSPKQAAKKNEINAKFLRNMHRKIA
jgi:hypothetical protein